MGEARSRTRIAIVLVAVLALLALLLLRSDLVLPGSPESSSAGDPERRGHSRHPSDATRSGGHGSSGGATGDSREFPGKRGAGSGDGEAGEGATSDGSRSGGGTFPLRPARRRVLRPEAPAGSSNRQTLTLVDLALIWLADHQREDGSWDPATLRSRKTGVRSSGGGRSVHRTGVTALAVLANLGYGETHKTGHYKTTVKAALEYLRRVQATDGRYVPADAEDGLLGHVWATYAMAQAFALTGSPKLQKSLVPATERLIDARTDDGGWPRKEGAADGDTDLTIWALLALHSAKAGGTPGLVPESVLAGGLAWMDGVTDGPSGLVVSTRHEEFDLRRDLWLSAGAALARALVSNSNESHPVRSAAEQCLRRLPDWREGEIDIPLLHLGTYAVFQVGGTSWRTWNTAMKKAVIDSQRREKGDLYGSWDPVGPWADQGGRVWSTAVLAMCMEVYYFYNRVPVR